ncbi:DUF222 domain-containing protein [Arthrobacter oryzae]|uniref:HNH endonuclease signature motif containing protein n=1 Tax=Arthrobacter oryzae TaxID=409290 RepID=UPI0028673A43|nr:DUF222 domain-containing protein [Arthrobacter oryzae]MDR6504849.1 hypothetical protein [Arthrobacter oryzae]
MEAVGDLAAGVALRWATLPAAGSAVPPAAVPSPAARVRGLRSIPAGLQHLPVPGPDGGASGELSRCLELLKAVGSTAVEDAALLSFREAADFAASVEEVSRAAEYLQIVAAGAVNRTRREAQAAARSAVVGSGSAGSGAAVGWVTGWGTETAGDHEGTRTPAAAGHVVPPAVNPAGPDPADDGSRNAAEFLRTSLRISIAEARRRIALSSAVLPRAGITGHIEPPVRPELAAAVVAAAVGSRAATIITLALDRVGHHAPVETLARMEHQLTRQAVDSDADLLSRVARHWIEGIDQDGSEPSEEELRRRQGVFLRQARRGLQHIEIFATPDQCEPLLTVMNTATNPRTRTGAADGRAEDTGDGDGGTGDADTSPNTSPGSGEGIGGAAGAALDLRTRPQRLLDGLVGACKAGLSTSGLPTSGGLRPQVMVTIDYRDLLDRLEHTTDQESETTLSPGSPRNTSTGRLPGTGSFTFTGPVNAATVRKIACDADIIPVLLGSEGPILDIGRATRIFPPHIRKAITARDQGCAFPGCTIPAPWCEAHHITYWSHGGSTSTENGTLLCSHHHHLIHKEQWHIQVKSGIPWFIPPPHIDPRQKPRRNMYFKT